MVREPKMLSFFKNNKIMAGEREKFMVPPWLGPLLKTEFYYQCSVNSHNKYETFFCYQCMGKALCENCCTESEEHRGHPFLRVFRASLRPALLFLDITKLLDISGIQPFIINSKQILYLNTDIQQAKQKPKNGSMCKICSRQIKDYKYDFCSIGCKVKSNENSIELYEKKCSSKRSLYWDSNGDVPSMETNEVEIIESRTSGEDNRFKRKRSRKGIPQRASFL